MHAVKSELPRRDRFHLEASEGWLGLADCASADAELDEITVQLRDHPDVLLMRHKIFSQAKRWEPAAEVAQALCRMAPDEPYGWFHLAYALHELKRTEEALNVLLPIAGKFPDYYLISYNLACYACQLGDLKSAKQWIAKAIDKAGKKDIRALAM